MKRLFHSYAGNLRTAAPGGARLGKGRAVNENYIDDDIETQDDADAEPESPRGLRKAANKSKRLEAELQQAQRELAFVKAGINPDDPKMRYFVKGYDGDLTAEAVRAAALDAGFLASQAPDSGQQATAAAQDRVMAASAGAVVEDTTEMAALAVLQQAMEEGGVDAMLEAARQYGIPIGSEM